MSQIVSRMDPDSATGLVTCQAGGWRVTFLAEDGVLLRCLSVLMSKGIVVSNLPESVPVWLELKLSKVDFEAPISLRLMAFVTALSNIGVSMTVDTGAHGWCHGVPLTDVAMAF